MMKTTYLVAFSALFALISLLVFPADCFAQETLESAASEKKAAQESAEEVLEKTQNPPSNNRSLTVQVLNKITASNTELTIEAGGKTLFGNLVIEAIDCWKSPPEERPEEAGLIRVWEGKNNEPLARRFYGWMFSSTPGLSALEHPIYDIVMLECNEGS